MTPLLLVHPDERARPTGPYEWAWSLHPSVLIGTGLLGALYFWGIGPLRRRHALGPPAEPWRVASFSAALLVLLFSLNGPLHDLSDYYLFSAHMVQHLLLTLVFPPLLIGIPGWLLSPLLRVGWVRAIARVLTLPVVSALLFTVTIAVWHLTPFYELMMRSHDVHIATHLMFIVAATILWFPVMSPVPELPRLSYGTGMLLYPWYTAAPRTWGLTPLADQQLGGLLMWVPGNLWMFLAIGVLFFKWAKETG